MRRNMGNQNANGIVGEERAKNDESDEPNIGGVSKQEDQICNDVQKTTEIVAQYDDDILPIVRNPPSDNDEINESFIEDTKNEGSDLHDHVSCNVEKSKEYKLKLEVCHLNNEEDDQPSNPKGYEAKGGESILHQPELQMVPDLTTEFAEVVEINLQQQELQNIVLLKESMETVELCDSSQIQKAEIEESLSPTKDILKTDIHNADMEQVDLELNNCTEKSEDGSVIETREEPGKEDMNSCEYLPKTGSPDKAPAINEMPDTFLILTEEMEHELHNGVNSTFSDQTQPHAQEMNHTFACDDAESDKKKIVDEIGFSKFSESIQREELIVSDEENVVDKEIGLLETESLIDMNKNQEISTVEKGMSQLQVIEHDPEQCSETITNETQVPLSLLTEKDLNTERYDLENAGGECIKSVEDKYVKVELKKSSSFDFGLPFDARSEETDQTPLLYQDRTELRSFSTCSNLINYKVTDQVEEKTIRMEKSSSDNSRAKKFNLVKKEEKSTSDEKQKNNLGAANITEDCSNASPKGNGNLKRKLSLFTACICCTTEAIS